MKQLFWKLLDRNTDADSSLAQAVSSPTWCFRSRLPSHAQRNVLSGAAPSKIRANQDWRVAHVLSTPQIRHLWHWTLATPSMDLSSFCFCNTKQQRLLDVVWSWGCQGVMAEIRPDQAVPTSVFFASSEVSGQHWLLCGYAVWLWQLLWWLCRPAVVKCRMPSTRANKLAASG